MSMVDEQLRIGLAHHQAGRRQQAEETYRRVLEANPAHAGAMHLLGVLALEAGRPDAAVQYLQGAVGLDGAQAAFHLHLAQAYHLLDRLDEAAGSYQRALRIQGNLAEAHNNLGTIKQARGDVAGAIDCYQQAVANKLDYADAHNNLGTAYESLGQVDQATDCFRRAIAVDPGYAKGYYNLGVALAAQDQLAEASTALERAVAIDPRYVEAHYGLALVLERRQDAVRAESELRQALRLRPDWPEAHFRLGSVLQQAERCEEAAAAYQQALRLKPDYVAAHNNLGNTLYEMGKLDEALACYDRGLSLSGETAQVHLNRGVSLLSQGRLAEGWPEFAWRLECSDLPRREVGKPRWDGSSFVGRTLLVHAEQGLGDTMQFVRYVPAVRCLGGRVVLEVQPVLAALLRCSGFGETIAAGDALPPLDLQVPLLHLPWVFQTTLENIPAEAPYLAADPERVERWQERLAAVDGFRVGIAWQGNRQHGSDRRRSIPLREFAPLAEVAGARLLSLQKGDGSEQLAEWDKRLDLVDLGSQLDNDGGAFMDTAAVMKHLDLVITPDTSIAHLAGALGVNAWVALSSAPDWRWFRDRDDSPWYPTMRLFRSSRRGDWSEVFARIVRELKRAVSGHD